MRGDRPSELDGLLDLLGRRQFLFQAFRTDRDGPEVLTAVRKRGDCADVLIVFDEQRAVAYRVLTGPGVDVYDPARVLWWYAHTAVWTLRALLTLPPSTHPDAPRTPFDAPPGFGIPPDRRTPVPPRKH
jgi:hypothetical protein